MDNNREIKFRAWDKSAQVMTALSRLSELPLKTEDEFTIIMQYTGLKDVKCVEIYESDIVSCDGMDNLIVVFDDGAFYAGDSGQLLSNYEFEVIGNIYETPELFEKKNE